MDIVPIGIYFGEKPLPLRCNAGSHFQTKLRIIPSHMCMLATSSSYIHAAVKRIHMFTEFTRFDACSKTSVIYGSQKPHIQIKDCVWVIIGNVQIHVTNVSATCLDPPDTSALNTF